MHTQGAGPEAINALALVLHCAFSGAETSVPSGARSILVFQRMSEKNSVGIGDDAKIQQVQEIFIKNLLRRCKAEQNEEFWQMPEMVGYYNEASLPIASVQVADEARQSVKKVVCSPDLPIASFPTSSNIQRQHQQSPIEQPQQPIESNPISSTTASITNVQCQVCNKMYNSRAAFQAHQRSHHPKENNEDPYRCNICSKTFAVPARLTRHYRTHTGEKPFRCEFCDKSFSVKENLSVHRRIHTKERPYKCDVCSRAFEHSGKLHRHMRIHTGERPHKCNVCAKTFIQSGQLVIHMRTHTGEKPYVCSVCKKGFTCSKQLKVHSRTHTGEKPYSCEICGKSFGYNHVLKLHQVAHYGEKVYKCTICNDTFNSKKSMEAHIKSHSEPPPTAPTPPASSASESSCSSDKENKDSLPPLPAAVVSEPSPVISYDSDIRYYIYPRDRLSPNYLPSYAGSGVDLLAAAASATERDNVVFNIIAKNPQEVMTALRHPPYFPNSSTCHQYPALNAGDSIRSTIEAVLGDVHSSEEENMLTPPSSNPPSPSPDPELSLPPRKRSKMILKSMEASIDLSPVRYSSVIQYAGAS